VIHISTLNRTRGQKPLRRLAGVAVAAVAVAVIALPAAALAADPTADQYGSQLQTLSAGSSGNSTPSGGGAPGTTATNSTPPAAGAPSATQSSGGGSLPFTGLDVGLLAAVAGGLALAGFMLRRQAREASGRS
jgi:hypothetical protein